MQHFTYDDTSLPIRDDIKLAYRAFWQNLSRPGSWWTGSERIAIAQEVRNATQCDFCAARKHAVSPYAFKGEHQNDGVLSEAAVDAVHRIVTDQGRITSSWVDNLVKLGLTKEAYVELSGVVVSFLSVDEFNRALGLKLERLPDALPGEPTGYRPAQAVEGTGFVPMIPVDGATGDESDLWQNGMTANVVRALTLVPNALRDWTNLAAAQYLSMQGMANLDRQEGRSLNRMQMELVAGRVSAINQCFY